MLNSLHVQWLESVPQAIEGPLVFIQVEVPGPRSADSFDSDTRLIPKLCPQSV